MNKYIIDANALINACHSYNMKKVTFLPIWNKLNEMINEGLLISTEEVFDELKDNDLVLWAKTNKKMFIPSDDKIQAKVTEILSKYPTMIKLKSTANSNADPFLIAIAILNQDSIVVTDEIIGDENSKDYHIPNICKKYGIKYINLREFIEVTVN